MSRVLLTFFLLCQTAIALEIPKLQARVTDLAGLLTEEQVRSLEAKLRDLETTDSTQVALLIIPSLEDEVLEDYSHRVATAWRLGRKERDNGALLLIAMKERKIRFEVGYGLEAVLTDARTRRITQTEIVPNFRQGRFYDGIDAGVTAVIQTVRGTYEAPARDTDGSSSRSSGRKRLDWIIFLFIPFLWIMGGAGTWGGGILGAGGGALLMALLAGFGWIALLLGGIIGGVIGAILGTIARASKRAPSRRRWGGHTTPWYYGIGSSGWGGGGSSGGGSSGGGFSGGGGSFGGGGSSGSW